MKRRATDYKSCLMLSPQERSVLIRVLQDFCPSTVKGTTSILSRLLLPDDPKHLEYVKKAQEEWSDEGAIEIDNNAIVSHGPLEHGAYVSAWVWVSKN